MALAAVDKAVLRQFRDDLSRLDASLRGRKVPFVDRLTNVAERQINSATASRYWNYVQSLFAWANAEGLIEANPAEGLKVERRANERRSSPEPFSEAELRKLFATPLYAGHASTRKVDEPGACVVRGGRWWSGVLALFTGLRAGELSQLLPSDFIFDVEVPHLRITDQEQSGGRAKRVKTAAAIRDVPLAPVLLQLGLREFVEAAAKRYSGRVFREFRLGSGDRTSDGMTKFWGPYLKRFGLWKAGRSTHVFRHTVAHWLRANGVHDEDIGAILGHAGAGITAGYGGAQTLARKAETLTKLSFGFDVLTELGGGYDRKRHGQA